MKTPIALLLADIHIHKDNLGVVRHILQQSLDIAKEKEISMIIILGDIFTERTGQNMFCLNTFLWYVNHKAFKSGELELCLIPGNHDKVDQELEDSYLDVFSGRNNITLFRKEEYIRDFNDGMTFCFLPYFKENGSYKKRLKSLKLSTEGQRRVLFTHISVDGARNNDGSVVTSGVSAKDFVGFDGTFIGHYHDFSEINKKVRYIGATHCHNYGEDNKKGFTVLYDDGSFEMIRSEFPKFIKRKFDLSEVSMEEIEKLRKKYEGSIHNIRFIFVGSDDQLAMVDRTKFEDSGIDVKTESRRILKNVEVAEETTIIKFDPSQIRKLFIQYCAKNRDKITPERREMGKKFINSIV